jgi:chorismate mutase-like protein
MFTLILWGFGTMTGGPFQTPDMNTAAPLLRPKTLDDLRVEIDAIDDSLHDLLMRRAGLAADVARLKASTGPGPLFRPGREAAVVRRILARHKGPFPPSAIARIWREVMSGMLGLQGGAKASFKVVTADETTSALAGDHFGTGASVKAVASPLTAIRAVATRRATVAVLPWPKTSDSRWWIALCKPKAPRIVAAAPALALPQALVVALQSPEPSGDDRSLIGCVSRGTFSPQIFLKSLTRHGLKGRLIARDKKAALFEVDGFVAENDMRLKAIDGVQATVIGVYAMPFKAGPFKQTRGKA